MKIEAVHVLNSLLNENLVKEEVIRSVYESLQKQVAVERNLPKQESATSDDVSKANSATDNGIKTTLMDSTESITKKSAGTTAYRTRHIAIQFYYDGGKYSGLAENVGREGDASIERQVFEALKKAHLIESRASCGYSRCGRTDRGVSAAGQVIALHVKSAFPMDACVEANNGEWTELTNDELPKNSHETRSVWVIPRSKKHKSQQNDDGRLDSSTSPPRELRSLSEYAYDKILNNLLPRDIRILAWTPVSDEFSARFSATDRMYRYFFVKRNLDLDLMQQGLDRLVGTHDFRNFCKMDVEKVYNFERKIYSAQVCTMKDDGGSDGRRNLCYLQVHGQAFLWHQIRCISSVIFSIGRGLEDPNVVTELLNVEEHPGKPSYPLADEHPLVLHYCGYESLKMVYSATNLWNVTCQLEQQWSELTLAAARVRNVLNQLTETAPASSSSSSSSSSSPPPCEVLVDELISFIRERLRQRAKRQKKSRSSEDPDSSTLEALLEQPPPPVVASNNTISWGDALHWMETSFGLILDPEHASSKSGGGKEVVYTPLLERARGTTYEEKVAAVQHSAKRRDRYEENVMKKRKTKEEDQAFYQHKIQQGGSNV